MPRKKRKPQEIVLKADPVPRDPKWSDLPYLDNLPDLCLQLIMDNLDIHTMMRVECWSKGWKEWLKEPYHLRYLTHIKEEEQRAQAQADSDDALWAEAFFSALTHPYLVTPIHNWHEFVTRQRMFGLPADVL